MDNFLNLEHVKNIIKKYFPRAHDFSWVDKIFAEFESEQFRVEKHNNTNVLSYGQIAHLMYRLENYILKNDLLQDFEKYSEKFKNYLIKEINCYISPMVKLEEDVVFIGNNIKIEGNYQINTGCVIYDNVSIINNTSIENDNKYYIIGKNSKILTNAKIYNSDIGENVVVDQNCIVRENIESFSKVQLVNQLQVTNRKSTYIPSQELTIYGLVPKYKNTLTIYGEGIYNPNIIVRAGENKVSVCEIDYWDKNKIILKIKCDKGYAKKIIDDEKIWNGGSFIKLVVMSRGIKTTINDYKAIIKLLKNI